MSPLASEPRAMMAELIEPRLEFPETMRSVVEAVLEIVMAVVEAKVAFNLVPSKVRAELSTKSPAVEM